MSIIEVSRRRSGRCFVWASRRHLRPRIAWTSYEPEREMLGRPDSRDASITSTMSS